MRSILLGISLLVVASAAYSASSVQYGSGTIGYVEPLDELRVATDLAFNCPSGRVPVVMCMSPTRAPSPTWTRRATQTPWKTFTPRATYTLRSSTPTLVKTAVPTQTPYPTNSPRPKPPTVVIPPSAGCSPGYKEFYGKCVYGLQLFAQRAWTETARGKVNLHSAYHSAGLALDRSVSPNRVYYMDSGNSRLLGFDALGYCDSTKTRCVSNNDCPGSFCKFDPTIDAKVAIGQLDAEGMTCNSDNNVGLYGKASDKTICMMQYPQGNNTAEQWTGSNFSVDLAGNVKFPDRWNNRGLQFNSPFENDLTADVIWGQVNPFDNLANQGLAGPTRTSLSLPAFFSPTFGGVSDDFLSRTYISDTGNGRVLRTPFLSPLPDLVIGQDNYTSYNTAGCDDLKSRYLCHPIDAEFDATTNELYVLDINWYSKQRFVVYDLSGNPTNASSVPFRTFIPSTPLTFPAGSTYQFTASGFSLNRYKVGKYATSVLVVTESYPGRRVVFLNRNGGFEQVVGTPSPQEIGGAAWYDQHGYCEASSYDYRVHAPSGSPETTEKGDLYIADEGLSRAALYDLATYEPIVTDRGTCVPPPKAIFPSPLSDAPDRLLGEPVGITAGKNQIYARDSRGIKVWDKYLAKADGAPSEFIVGPPTWTPGGWGQLAFDPDNNLVWGNNHEWQLSAFRVPVTSSGEAPVGTYLQLFWADTKQPLITGVLGVVYDKVRKVLWVGDGGRVLRVRNPQDVLIPGKPLYVDLTLGQVDRENRNCNRTGNEGGMAANNFCRVSHLALDPSGNLYVVEGQYECHANDRITIYYASTLDSAQGIFPNLNADRVVRREFTQSFVGPLNCAAGPGDVNRPFDPVAIAFDSKGNSVVANDGYSTDLKTRVWDQFYFYPSIITNVRPKAKLNIPAGSGEGIVFDEYDNFIFLDHTWRRIGVVKLSENPAMLNEIQW